MHRVSQEEELSSFRGNKVPRSRNRTSMTSKLLLQPLNARSKSLSEKVSGLELGSLEQQVTNI